jgi:hypothetical protein
MAVVREVLFEAGYQAVIATIDEVSMPEIAA